MLRLFTLIIFFTCNSLVSLGQLKQPVKVDTALPSYYKQYPPVSKQNTMLICKLLDTLKTGIDSSYKQLFIDANLYSTDCFVEFAKEMNMPCVITWGTNCDSVCALKSHKTVTIRVSTNPFITEVSFGNIQCDGLGSIIGTMHAGDKPKPPQHWKYDKNKHVFIKLKEKPFIPVTPGNFPKAPNKKKQEKRN